MSSSLVASSFSQDKRLSLRLGMRERKVAYMVALGYVSKNTCVIANPKPPEPPITIIFITQKVMNIWLSFQSFLQTV